MIDPEWTFVDPSGVALRELATQCGEMAEEAEDMARDASGETRAIYLRLATLWSALETEIGVSLSSEKLRALDS